MHIQNEIETFLAKCEEEADKLRAHKLDTLRETLFFILPTVKNIRYEWDSEYDDNGRYNNNVTEITVNLQNGASFNFNPYDIVEPEWFKFFNGKTIGESIRFNSGDEIECELVTQGLKTENGKPLTELLRRVIEELVHAGGEDCTGVDFHPDGGAARWLN